MPMKSPKICIIVLNWNRPDDTLECLSSLENLTYPNYEILLVDNGSTDNSCARFREKYPEITLIENGKNLGFAEGNNCGIAIAQERGAEYILLLNNDTVVHPALLDAFYNAAAAHPQAGVFGAKIYYYDEPATIWYAGGEVDLHSLRCYHIGCLESDLEGKRNSITPTSYACGCALFIKAEVIQKVGLMELKFFLLWEEIDWCWRIRKAGYDCLFVPEAKVWHKISASFEGGNHGPQWEYFNARNRLLFFERNYPFPQLIKIYFKSLKSARSTPSALKGFRDYFLRRFGNLV